MNHREKLYIEAMHSQIEELIKIVASHTKRIATLEKQIQKETKAKTRVGLATR